ncbi:MAG: M20/M25/M40 family metallo-hydrolase [Ferruginibacter sp.]|nr:M20/M25/M40 family metallo-hydrolase [Cytophagales bacterium]
MLFSLLLFSLLPLRAQPADSLTIRRIFDEALRNGHGYRHLDYLSNRIGGRLSGSPQAAAAVEWGYQVMKSYGFDTVYTQEVMVPHWVRGDQEVARILNSSKAGNVDVAVCALGGSVGTGDKGIAANVVEVRSFEELARLGKKGVEGKIVFFNRAFDPTRINTFDAYGEAVTQRGAGASEAAKYGAVGAVVRSMTTRIDGFPHTGGMRYQGPVRIPAVAICTRDAELLSGLLKEDGSLKFYFRTTCETRPDVKSHNVVGETKGSTTPGEIITVGGHLDSWDTGHGAHDDGAGCVQSIEVLRIFKTLGIRPKRTVRAVLFMNEENGLRGGTKYAELAVRNREKHIFALESDRGGFSPRGFSFEGNPAALAKILRWKSLLEPYGLHDFSGQGGGADIGPLAKLGVPVMELVPDPQRYFDFHHTSTDRFEFVNQRELELGGAAMAALIYLVSEYGL